MKHKLIIIIIASIIISVVPSSHPAWKYGIWDSDDTTMASGADDILDLSPWPGHILDADADSDTTMMSSADDIVEPPAPPARHIIIIIEKQWGSNE